MFWVPGGIATIFAIKNAGLAVGIGVGSSFIVLVSFTWGIFVFDEHVHSRLDACFAVGCMMLGLLGMAKYSAPNATVNEAEEESSPGTDYQCLDSVNSDDPEALSSDQLEDQNNNENDALVIGGETVLIEHAPLRNDILDAHLHIYFWGVKCSRRTLGIMAAVFSGVYGGSVMVPMKYAPLDDHGIGFLISFAIGAATVNLALWIIRCLYLSLKLGSFSEGYNALPSMHLEKMWKYGAACGLLWSIGNFFSIISVEYLGEGVGYSVVQSSILVSGLWGIFYFHEVEGYVMISKWLLSASTTVVGILLLSYEHHEK